MQRSRYPEPGPRLRKAFGAGGLRRRYRAQGRRNFSNRTFAYVVDDDKLWLTGMEEWLKEPQEMGVVQVMKYCPGN